jgi:hypothetical protein
MSANVRESPTYWAAIVHLSQIHVQGHGSLKSTMVEFIPRKQASAIDQDIRIFFSSRETWFICICQRASGPSLPHSLCVPQPVWSPLWGKSAGSPLNLLSPPSWEHTDAAISGPFAVRWDCVLATA